MGKIAQREGQLGTTQEKKKKVRTKRFKEIVGCTCRRSVGKSRKGGKSFFIWGEKGG